MKAPRLGCRLRAGGGGGGVRLLESQGKAHFYGLGDGWNHRVKRSAERQNGTLW